MSTVTLIPEPGKVVPPLWAHQRQAVDFADGKPGVLLALCMGAGKSYVTVYLLVTESWQRTLILCPKSVMAVWPREFEKYCPAPVRLVVLDSGTVARKAAEIEAALRARENDCQTVIIVNYESAWREPLASTFGRARLDALVLDEAHRIKAAGGKASRFCAKLAGGSSRNLPIRRRIGLTGTPMPHSPLDVYGQLRAIDRSVFGTSNTTFKARYSVSGGFEGRQIVGWQNMEEFAQRLDRVTMRVGAGVLRLQAPVHVERFCELGPKARRIYEDLETDLMAEVEQGTITASNALAKLLRLRQVSSGHTRLEDGTDVEVGTHKAELLADVIEDIEPDEPIVVFAVFRRDLDGIRRVAKMCGRSSSELSGRENTLSDWQAGRTNTLAVQIQAGGVGVDLTRARYCLYFSVGFSLGEFDQSLARVQRPGQTRQVVYIHLIAERTVDAVVYRALRKKADVVAEVLAALRGTEVAA